MSVSYKNTYFQDATPTPERIGDEWITSAGVVRICYQVTPTALWALLTQSQVTNPNAAVHYLRQSSILYSAFTDGGAAVGTYTMSGVIPAGAQLLPCHVRVVAGFANDTSAVMIIGDGSDTDRCNTSTINVFTTAASGVVCGAVSGIPYVGTAFSPVLTVTTNADFTSVNAGNLTVAIPYLVFQ